MNLNYYILFCFLSRLEQMPKSSLLGEEGP